MRVSLNERDDYIPWVAIDRWVNKHHSTGGLFANKASDTQTYNQAWPFGFERSDFFSSWTDALMRMDEQRGILFSFSVHFNLGMQCETVHLSWTIESVERTRTENIWFEIHFPHRWPLEREICCHTCTATHRNTYTHTETHASRRVSMVSVSVGLREEDTERRQAAVSASQEALQSAEARVGNVCRVLRFVFLKGGWHVTAESCQRQLLSERPRRRRSFFPSFFNVWMASVIFS